jgi:hypothetical protein
MRQKTENATQYEILISGTEAMQVSMANNHITITYAADECVAPEALAATVDLLQQVEQHTLYPYLAEVLAAHANSRAITAHDERMHSKLMHWAKRLVD